MLRSRGCCDGDLMFGGLFSVTDWSIDAHDRLVELDVGLGLRCFGDMFQNVLITGSNKVIVWDLESE